MSAHDNGGIDPSIPYGDAPEPSLGELFGSLTNDLSQLVRSEMELARVEIREEAGKAGKAAGMLGGGRPRRVPLP